MSEIRDSFNLGVEQALKVVRMYEVLKRVDLTLLKDVLEQQKVTNEAENTKTNENS